MNGRSSLKWLGGVAAATLASGWIGHAVNRARNEEGMDSPGAGIWIATPLAAVTVTRLLRRNQASGGWDPRVRPRWYAAAVAAFPAVTGVALTVGKRAGWVDTSAMNLPRLAKSMAASCGPGLVKNVLEESVWQGYFTAELVDRRVRDSGVYLGTGLVWALWHVPYWLYFLPEEEVRKVLDVPRGVFALRLGSVVVAWAVPYAELFRLSGSIWPGVLMHTLEDMLNAVFVEEHARIAAGRRILISPIVGVPSLIHLGLGLVLRAVRRRRYSS